MRKFLYICLFASVFTACQSGTAKNEMVIIPTPNGVPSASSMPVQNTAAPVQNAAADGEKPVNNPAHGQPYHDCTIAVGAPLASVQGTPVQTSAPVPAVTASPVQAQPASAAPGVKLNPAHGEPGHSCKIAVGAPLT
ncbi:hypothetical protein [Pedobacter metabolipauper]|nr:hypothetical protein [Pedobacter metabolipauper]